VRCKFTSPVRERRTGKEEGEEEKECKEDATWWGVLQPEDSHPAQRVLARRCTPGNKGERRTLQGTPTSSGQWEKLGWVGVEVPGGGTRGGPCFSSYSGERWGGG